MAAPRSRSGVRGLFAACERFVKDYTAGLRAQDVRRLFDQDAAEAYGVLVRDQDAEAEPADGFRRFWYRVRVVFLGFSYKLTPVRRLLFAAAIILLVIGLLDVDVRFAADDRRLSIDFSALFFLLSVGSLVFLLALELVDRIRVRDELQVARELQSDLLPRDVPEIEGYRMRHSYRTANEVGGDYYDFSLLEDGRLAVMVGDASGHGMAAGLLMAIANATLKLALDLDPAPPSVLRMLNRTLCRTGDRRSFMSIFYGLLDPTSGVLEFASAGHPFPLLRRLSGEVEELGEGGLALGFRDDLEFRAYSTTVECGDAMVLYSDGLPEGVDGSGDSFGYERLRDLVTAGGTAEAIHERILLAFDQYRGDEPLADDFSLVVVGRSTTVPPPPP